jgi:hypothetical protein
MDDAKSGDMSNVVYLNPIQRITRVGYAQVSEVVNGKAVGLIGEAGAKIPVMGMSDDLPALTVGDWVRVMESILGAHIIMHIEIDKGYAGAGHGLEPGRWYELFSSPVKLNVSIEAVRGGWIMRIGDGNYKRLNAEAMTLKDEDGRLTYIEKSSEAIELSGSDGYLRVAANKVATGARSMSVCLGESFGCR